jgi:hypothetical protein
VTPSVSSKSPPHASGNQPELTSSPADACTTACTSEEKPTQTPSLEALAAALLGLSPEDRAQLAAMLLGQQPGG